jgi:sugar lactone lactonase YvrE
MAGNVELILDTKSQLGEGPVWSADDQVLYWVNIHEHLVHVYNPADGSNRSINVGQAPGTVVRRRSVGLMLAVANGFATLDLETEAVEVVANPEQKPKMRYNDGKCDPAGRFWAGSLGEAERDPVGTLWALEADLTTSAKIENLTIPNGIVWTSDHKTMYYIDTPTFRVDAYDYDIDSGNLSNHRVAVTVAEEDCWPDGMAIDAEDMIWVAHWGGARVNRYNPQTGEKILQIDVPSPQTTAPAFGGPDLKHLYITSASHELDEKTLSKYPHAGGLFMVEVDVPGVPADSFAG